MTAKERRLLRGLARRYLEICQDPMQDERRWQWRRLNSLQGDRPLIYVRKFAFDEMPESQCVCTDPFFRHYEYFFRYHLFWNSLGDDTIF